MSEKKVMTGVGGSPGGSSVPAYYEIVEEPTRYGYGVYKNLALYLCLGLPQKYAKYGWSRILITRRRFKNNKENIIQQLQKLATKKLAREKITEILQKIKKAEKQRIKTLKKRRKIKKLLLNGKFEEAFKLDRKITRKLLRSVFKIDTKNCIIVDANNRFRAFLLSRGKLSRYGDWYHSYYILCGVDDANKPWSRQVIREHYLPDPMSGDPSVVQAMADVFDVQPELVTKSYLQGDVLFTPFTPDSQDFWRYADERGETQLGRHKILGKHLFVTKEIRFVRKIFVNALEDVKVEHPEHKPIELPANTTYIISTSHRGD